MPSRLPSAQVFVPDTIAPQVKESLLLAPRSPTQSKDGANVAAQPSPSDRVIGTLKPMRCTVFQGAAPPNAAGLEKR